MVLTPGLFPAPPPLILLAVSYRDPIFGLHRTSIGISMKPPCFPYGVSMSSVVNHVPLASLLRCPGATEKGEHLFVEGTYVRGGESLRMALARERFTRRKLRGIK